MYSSMSFGNRLIIHFLNNAKRNRWPHGNSENIAIAVLLQITSSVRCMFYHYLSSGKQCVFRISQNWSRILVFHFVIVSICTLLAFHRIFRRHCLAVLPVFTDCSDETCIKIAIEGTLAVIGMGGGLVVVVGICLLIRRGYGRVLHLHVPFPVSLSIFMFPPPLFLLSLRSCHPMLWGMCPRSNTIEMQHLSFQTLKWV